MPDQKCLELFSRLSDYLDGTLEPALAAELERHLADCLPCEGVARTLRRTVDLCHRLPPQPVPEDVRREVRALLDRLIGR